jgi:hypothetical protein
VSNTGEKLNKTTVLAAINAACRSETEMLRERQMVAMLAVMYSKQHLRATLMRR